MGFTTEISGQKYGPGPVLPTGYCCRDFGPSSLRWLSSVVWAVSAHPRRPVSDPLLKLAALSRDAATHFGLLPCGLLLDPDTLDTEFFDLLC